MKTNFSQLMFLLLFCFSLSTDVHASQYTAQKELKERYNFHCQTPSDIYEHLPVLRQLASECSSVVEIGIRDMVSTWGILLGLSESQSTFRTYLGIDLSCPPLQSLSLANRLCKTNGIVCDFWQENDMHINIPPSEMLFIDSLHTYCHLTYELETFSPNISKYIAMHDTSDPWGNRDDTEYQGDYSEYPVSYDRSKRGLWLAVEDFLERHPEWSLYERRLNNHGLTILKRVF